MASTVSDTPMDEAAESSNTEQVKAPAKPEPAAASKRNATSTATSPKKMKTNAKAAPEQKAPFHFLMLPISEQPQTQLLVEPTLLTDRKLRRDYLARRFRAYHLKPTADNNSEELPSLLTATTRSSDTTLWSGASSVERALVGCCELPPFQKDKERAKEFMPGGSLARGYEVRFAGLVAKYCYNFKDRVLALAILERTLEQDQQEAKLEQEEEQQQEETTNKDEKKKEPSEEDMDDDEEEEESEEDLEPPSDDDEWDPKNRSPRRSARRSTRIQRSRKGGRAPNKKAKQGANTKPQAIKSAGDPAEAKADDSEEPKETANADRMTKFFSAGGLKILKTWLMDAMTPVYSPIVKGKTKSKASQFGLMLLPLLHLLSKIPFDKNLIVESKINKQIRKLSKHVDGLIDIFKNGKKIEEDEGLQKALDSYEDPGAGGCVLIRVQEILNELKATWEEHAKKDAEQQTATNVKDPLESVKRKLKDRLGEMNDMEAGKIEKPEWLTKCEEMQRERERKRPRASLPTTVMAAKKVATTQQLALKEREAERSALKNKLKAAQEERKAHLQRLKNQINKRVHGNATTKGHQHATRAATKKRKKGKTVKWKDGLSSDKQKKKDVLEEVFILPKDHSMEDEADRVKEENITLVVEEPQEEPVSPLAEENEEDNDDDEDLFEYDDTLLL